MASWALRPSSGGGFVPASKNSGRAGGPGAFGDRALASSRYGRRRPRTASGARTSTDVGGRLKPPPSPPRDAPSCADIDALEQALLISIRTAGLKPGRENQLADEATRLRRRRKSWLEDTEKVLREWAAHTSLLWELHEQELSKLNDGRREKERQHARSVALMTKQLGEERERVCGIAAQEREAAAAQLRAAQEAHELWKKAHQDETTAAAQREIARATVRLRRDAAQHVRSVKENLEAESAEQLASAVEQGEHSAARASAANKKVARLESVTRRLEAQLAEAAERTRRIERLSQTQKDVVEEVKVDLEKRARRLARRLEEEQSLNDREKSAHESAILAVRTQWKEELQAVDERVRNVVDAKEQAIQQLTEELETATHRAETAEALLKELQLGICPLASSPCRESRNAHRQAYSSPARNALLSG